MRIKIARKWLWFSILLCPTAVIGQTQSRRPPINGIAQVEIYSTNLKAAGHFFSTAFGISHSSDYGECQWGNISEVLERFYFYDPCFGQHVKLNDFCGAASAPLLNEIIFATTDLAAMKRYLRTRNVQIDAKSTGDRYFAVVDPEGHRIGFFQEPIHIITATLSIHRLRLIHAGFVVHDRAAEDKFYKDILGFHVYWHGGMKDGEDNWVDMQVPDGTDWIEYMLRVPENASHKTLGVMNHIALGVPDIHAAKEQLIKNGFKPTEEPKIGRDGKWQLNLYDPDQTRVELMEFTPTEKACCAEYTGPHPHP